MSVEAKVLTVNDIQQLISVDEACCISILMPTHRTGRETSQDPIRFKNLVDQVESALADRGKRCDAVNYWIGPLRQFEDDETFWQHQQDGLAIFCLENDLRVYTVPFELPEKVVVGKTCYVLPLTRMFHEADPCFVLALSPKRVNLYRCTKHRWEEVHLPGWPEEFAELARYIEAEDHLQFHTGSTPTGNIGGSERSAVYHGHPGGEAEAERKLRLLEYCRLIDDRIHEAIAGNQRRTPLVLACAERLGAIFREATKYPNVLAPAVEGNPDETPAEELCRGGWSAIEPRLEEQRESAVSRFHEAQPRQRTTRGLADVLPAAQEGRVETLFLQAQNERWGEFNLESQECELHDPPTSSDEELLNLAAVIAHRQGADVFAITDQAIPGDASASAILRY